MKYMLLIYMDEKAMTDAERAQCYKDSTKLTHDLNAAGQFLGANPLQSVSTATSLRIREGKRLVTDGPFAETREQLRRLLPRRRARFRCGTNDRRPDPRRQERHSGNSSADRIARPAALARN